MSSLFNRISSPSVLQSSVQPTPAQPAPIEELQSASSAAATSAVFQLTDSTKVPFDVNHAPAQLAYQGKTYQLSQKSGNVLTYVPADANDRMEKLTLTYTGGKHEVIVGYEKKVVGYEKVFTGQYKDVPVTKTVTHEVTVQEPYQEEVDALVKVTRELDGKNNTGVVGQILNNPNFDLSQADALFKNPAAGQFLVNSLTSASNAAQSDALLTGDNVLGFVSDYVSGDPQVGGSQDGYAPVTVNPDLATLTVLKDGLPGRQVTVNSQIQTINAQGNKAFTGYGFVLDDGGQKTQAVLSGGQLIITGPNGQQTQLIPPQSYVVGNPADPVGKFYYANVPGGENGQLEQRLVFEYYEKASPEVIEKLVAQGFDRNEVSALRTTNQLTFGFRVPDGQGSTYRQSAGVGNGPALTQSNGVATYYDANFQEGDSYTLHAKGTVTKYRDVTKTVTEQVTEIEHQPIYADQPIYQDVPVKETAYDILTKLIPTYTHSPAPCPTPAPAPVPSPYHYPTPRPIYHPTGGAYQPVIGDTIKLDANINSGIYAPSVLDSKYGVFDPVVLDLNGNNKVDTAHNKTEQLDLNGDGKLETVQTITDGLLFRDLDDNGKLSATGEVFGNFSNGKRYADGYAALRDFAQAVLGSEIVEAKFVLNAAMLQKLEAQGLKIRVGDAVKKPSELGITKLDLNGGSVQADTKAKSKAGKVVAESSFTINGENHKSFEFLYKTLQARVKKHHAHKA